jgi:hypothetical protein
MLLFESLLRSGFSSETTIPYLFGKRSGAMNDVRLLDRCFFLRHATCEEAQPICNDEHACFPRWRSSTSKRATSFFSLARSARGS